MRGEWEACEGGMENTQGQRKRRGEWEACEGKRERVVCVCVWKGKANVKAGRR